MNYANHWLWLLLLGCLYSCIREEPLPEPSSIDKHKREKLGLLLQEAIANDSEYFPLLSATPPIDTAYWYLQRLYDQLTNPIRIDNRSPRDNRWDPERKWTVHILDRDDDKIAFTIPGGDFYISTGFLKAIEFEFEIYYIMAFEAALVDKRFLLNQLISEYNTRVLLDFIRGKSTTRGLTASEMARTLANLEYDPDIVAATDLASANLICKSSIYDRFGLLSLLDKVGSQDHWIRTRPLYAGRTNRENLLLLPLEGDVDCGELRSNGGYRQYVLGKLP